jgi:ribonuclease HII
MPRARPDLSLAAGAGRGAGGDEAGRGPLAGPVVAAAVVFLRPPPAALVALSSAPAHVVVDGDRCPRLDGLGLECTIEAVIGGDATVPSVSAASILAKCARDRFMRELDARYPGYGFAGHKGYPTAGHVAALRRLGPSPVHRRSFAPVQFSGTP